VAGLESDERAADKIVEVARTALIVDGEGQDVAGDAGILIAGAKVERLIGGERKKRLSTAPSVPSTSKRRIETGLTGWVLVRLIAESNLESAVEL
jgi:hypothetical protein